MISAARVISNTQKYGSGLSLLRHEELHWLDVINRVRYKLAQVSTGIPFATWDRSTVPDKLLMSALEVTGRQYLLNRN